MSTPDDTLFEEAFGEFAHAAELMVDPVDSAVIHGRVRRRRTTKGAVAAALAALIVAVPAAWWLQESNGDEVDPPPAEETTGETTEEETSPVDTGTGSGEVPQGQETESELILPTFNELVGAEIELPEFFPGAGSLNDACPTAPATIGTAEDSGYGDGRIRLLKLVQVRLEEDGPLEAVALFGCTPGDALVTQAVAIAGDGEGGWDATEEVALGDSNSFPLVDIAPAAVTGLLLLVTEPHGTDHSGPLDYDIFRYRTGATLEDVTATAYQWGITDLGVEVEKTDNGDGTWTAAVTVTNNGDHEPQPFDLELCVDEGLSVEGADDMAVCLDGTTVAERYETLAPGDAVTTEWTVEAGPVDEWSGDAQVGGAYFEARVSTDMYTVDTFAFDFDVSNNYANMVILPEEVDAGA
ncbi:hypothetical protein GCM10009830_45200 [Glycomyces endophyticus]|uniref:DUF4352 domain-containing protein n=1 Tax=Glycomyces endophyticus TaxID=480996 RepID=A0ABP4TS38_9ACTN